MNQGWTVPGFYHNRKVKHMEHISDKSIKKRDRSCKSEEQVLYIMGWVIFACICLVSLIIRLWPEGRIWQSDCIFHVLTGFYCPGCGGTRAVKFLFRGHLLISLLFHPFVLYTAATGGWFMISHTLQRLSGRRLNIGMKYRDGYLWAGLIIVVLNFLVKNGLLLLGVDALELLEAGI